MKNMKYTILLWPHANVRYRTETLKLAQAELSVMLRRIARDATFAAEERCGMPMLTLETSAPLTEGQVHALRGLSLMYGLFEQHDDGAMTLRAGRETAWLGEDLPGILKYKGKTNELFTQLLMNVALYSSDFWAEEGAVKLLDPMCGRATTLFLGANRRWDCTGADVDRNDLREAEQFFKRYLEYHHYKHAVERNSRTIPGKKPASGVRFTFSDTPENYKQKNTATLQLVNADAVDAKAAFGARAFHLIVCDLPYGVQHSSYGGSLEKLLAAVLPGWREALMPGGVVAVSFNAQTLKTAKVRELMAQAGMEPLDGEEYDQFSHWVEQAVTRDIAICRRV